MQNNRVLNAVQVLLMDGKSGVWDGLWIYNLTTNLICSL